MLKLGSYVQVKIAGGLGASVLLAFGIGSWTGARQQLPAPAKVISASPSPVPSPVPSPSSSPSLQPTSIWFPNNIPLKQPLKPAASSPIATAKPTHTSSLAQQPGAASTTTRSPKPTASPAAAKAAKPPALPAPPAPSQAEESVSIRVAIVQDQPSVTIASSTAAQLVDFQGRPLGQLSAAIEFQVSSGGGLLRLNKWQSPGIWIQPQQDGLVYVDGRWYRGAVLLVSRGTTLMAINFVDLEEYLKSVVGAEMYASWPQEALKAQAIAARSYAIAHIYRPASDWYDLGDNERYQAYKGVNSEFNTTHSAVDATRGLVLTYKGGVVESLYAADDQLVKTAHQGFGMSQEGANRLASQGYSYLQILGSYYPGASLSRLEPKS